MVRKTRSKLITWALLLALIAALVPIIPWSTPESKNAEMITSPEQLDGHKIGMLKEATYNVSVKKLFPNSTIQYYSTFADMIQDLKYDRISAYIASEPIARSQEREVGELNVLSEHLTQNSYGFVLSKENQTLCDQLNAAIEELRKEGVLEELENKWMIHGDYSPTQLDLDTSDKKLLKVATNGDMPPFSFLANGEMSGYDVDIIKLAADRIGYKAQVIQYAFGSLLNSVMSKNADIAIGCITCTEERNQAFLFTEATYIGPTVAVVKGEVTPTNFFDSIISNVNKTLIEQQRWKQILQGIGVTSILAIATLLIGSLLGFIMTLFLRSDNYLIAHITSCIVKVLDTIPLLIIFMLLYYVIFVKFDMNAIIIGIIGLTLNFSITVAQLFDTGLNGVNRFQLEAARAMGYSNLQIFNKIAFPQALQQMYNQYTGAITSMVKDTSIVSYITIQDLTNIGDSIRSATYQAFFPLLLVAVIYFLLAKILTFVLSLGLKHLDPQKKKRYVKGVKTDD